MKYPEGYRLVRIRIINKDNTESNAVFLTILSSIYITKLVSDNPGTAIDTLISSGRAFLIDIDPIDEIYTGTL